LAAVAVALVELALLASPARAQQPPVRPSAGPGIALVDVSYIFKHHPRFKAQEEEIKADAERAQMEFKRVNDAIAKDAERLNEFRPGTPDYKAAEEDIVNRKMKLQGSVQLQKKEFMQRDAKIYYNVYTEIMQEVQYYCQANAISLVLDFNGDAINPDNPSEVARGLQRQVIYYNKDLDITPYVLKRLGAPPANPGPVGFQQQPPQQPNGLR
jgi:Skp family chaperone for outer membrane proteins